MVFQALKKVKVRNMVFQHWEEVNYAKQWCFSIIENDEGLLTMVFQQRKKAKQLLDEIVLSMMEGEKMKGC
jgi:hypothetical protein